MKYPPINTKYACLSLAQPLPIYRPVPPNTEYVISISQAMAGGWEKGEIW